MNNFINYLKNKFFKEDAAPGNVVGDGNQNVKLMAKPISQMSKRWGGKEEFVIPHAQYESIKRGRDYGSRWDTHIPVGEVQSAVRNALYKDGAAVLTSDFTQASVILKHYKQQRWRQNDEITLS